MSLEVAGRQAECPECGGPIEWKLGSSAALVCPWCRTSVVRTDRDLTALGRVADLVPTFPAMAVGDTGRIQSGPNQVVGFTVLGRVQLDHGSGPWDEWYVGFSDGSWGYVAKAQGEWLVTSHVNAAALPNYDAMGPGVRGTLPTIGGNWVVAERGTSTVLSAEGELPDPVSVGDVARYVDLHGDDQAFATIDYGTAGVSAPETVLFAGKRLAPGALAFRQDALGPRPTESVAVQQLLCPSCGGPCPVLTPGTAERAVCPACNALLDFKGGAFEFLGQLKQPRVVPLIPLGTPGTLQGLEMLCIGLMERSVDVEGVRYSWREYLLHSAKGYRWLLEDAGHFTLVAPIPATAVQVQGTKATYGGTRYKLFALNQATVRFVIGEFYWKVQVGEQSETTDFIAPPLTVSEDRSKQEIQWSAGRYIDSREVWRGFKLDGKPPRAHDVAPTMPNPVGLKLPAVVTVLGALVLLAMSFAFRSPTAERTLLDGPIEMPRNPEPNIRPGQVPTPMDQGPSVHITKSPEFELPAGAEALEVTLKSDLGSGWLGLGASLIHRESGTSTSFTLEQDRFHASGAARTTNRLVTKETIGGLAPGHYVLRLDPRWARKGPTIVGTGGASLNAPTATVSLRNKVPSSSGCFCFSFLLILLPVPFAFLRRLIFESRRWRNSTV